MIKTVVVTVVFPQTFSFEIDTEADTGEVLDAIKDHAGYLMETSQSDPYIIDCTDKTLVGWD